jgi:8-oxo-dGTP pyrophosphatase MutT (NUDIX family)
MEVPNSELHRIATTAIIYTPDRRYLIIKRSPHKKVFPGKWTVPGGGLETDDYTKTPPTHGEQWYYSLTNGLRREVKEETGTEIGTAEYLLDLTFIRPDGIPVLVLSYLAAYIGGEVVLDADSTEYAWITASEIDRYDFIAGIPEEIVMADELLRKRMSA